MSKSTAVPLLVIAFVVAAACAGPKAGVGYEDGKFPPPRPAESKWVDLLAGKLEDHWSDMNCTLAGSFKLSADEKGAVVLAGTGRPIGLVRSLRPYENFILEVDWRHLTEAPSSAGGKGTTGNSGLYVWADPLPPPGNSFTRAIEVQVCNLGNGAWYTSHGDLFPIHGAAMTPDPRFGVAGSRSMPVEFRGHKTGEWNHCRVTCVDGTVQEEFNGALVSAGFRCSPRKGYLCLESEGGPVEFRNMRLTELPGDPALKPEQVSLILPAGARTACLYNGLDLDQWSAGEGQKGQWAAEDRVLGCAGRSKGDLSRPLAPGDFTLSLDWATDPKDPGAKDDAAPFAIDGLGLPEAFAVNVVAAGEWNRAEIKVGGGKVGVRVNGKVAVAARAAPEGADGRRVLRLLNPGHKVRFCNVLQTDCAVGGDD